MTTIKEVWKEYPECDKYLVSNTGKVYSKYYKKELAFAEDKDGYLKLQLWKNHKPFYRRVHQMVAKTFLPNPNCYEMVNHKDANVKNNRVDNLEGCDNSYNQWYRYNVLGEKWNRECHLKNFTKIRTTDIRTGQVLEFDSVNACARYYKCDDCCIHNRLRGRANNPSNSIRSKINGIYFEVIA